MMDPAARAVGRYRPRNHIRLQYSSSPLAGIVSDMAYPFFTIGHSTRPVDEFVSLLMQANDRVQTFGMPASVTVVDVRPVPRSRMNPQYNPDVLVPALSECGVRYERFEALGGLRGKSREVPATVNAFWDNQSFHNYADYALGERFRVGLRRLRDIGDTGACAIMCAEAVWWRCHRRIITDYLLAAGEAVFHILGPGPVKPARMTQAARLRSDGAITYPAGR